MNYTILRYSPFMKVFSVVLAAAILYLTIQLITAGAVTDDQIIEATVVLLVLNGMALAFTIETFYINLVVNDELIYISSPWAKNRTILWKDVVSIKYSSSARWYIVEDCNSTKIRVYYLLSNLEEFLYLAEEKVGYQDEDI